MQAIEQETSDPKHSTMLAVVDALVKHGVLIFGESELYLGTLVLKRPPEGQPIQKRVRVRKVSKQGQAKEP